MPCLKSFPAEGGWGMSWRGMKILGKITMAGNATVFLLKPCVSCGRTYLGKELQGHSCLGQATLFNTSHSLWHSPCSEEGGYSRWSGHKEQRAGGKWMKRTKWAKGKERENRQAPQCCCCQHGGPCPAPGHRNQLGPSRYTVLMCPALLKAVGTAQGLCKSCSLLLTAIKIHVPPPPSVSSRFMSPLPRHSSNPGAARLELVQGAPQEPLAETQAPQHRLGLFFSLGREDTSLEGRKPSNELLSMSPYQQSIDPGKQCSPEQPAPKHREYLLSFPFLLADRFWQSILLHLKKTKSTDNF